MKKDGTPPEPSWKYILTHYNSIRSQSLDHEPTPDDHLYYCECCTSVYSVEGDAYQRSYRLHRYEDFPTYKIQRKNCPECEPGQWVYGSRRRRVA